MAFKFGIPRWALEIRCVVQSKKVPPPKTCLSAGWFTPLGKVVRPPICQESIGEYFKHDKHHLWG